MLIHMKSTHIGLQHGSFLLWRCLSVLPEIKNGVQNNPSKLKKKFAILRKDRSLKSFNNNFLNNLFLAKIDEGLLKYPNVVPCDQTESLLQHVNEIKNYFNNLAEDNIEINKVVLNKLQKLELLGLTVPVKYNGLGYSEAETNFIYEYLGVCPKVSNLISYNENFGVKILSHYGTEEQKSKYLPKLASGECFISLAYLENGPIADLTSLKCNLLKDKEKDCFLLNGEKKWVANVNISDLIIVLSKSNSSDRDKLKVKFNLNIIEKNTPGITIKEVQSNKNRLMGLYEIKFDNVIVQNSSFISSDTQCGIAIVKNALSFSSLSASVHCLSILKKILTCVGDYYTKITPNEKALNKFDHLPSNIKWLIIYIYALESVIYLISGWFDEFDKPDLFAECSLSKILATDMLKSGISNYLQIMGIECFKPPSLLKDALQILHLVSVFDENNFYLKTSIGCYGILHASKNSSQIRETVNIIRQPYNYPWKSLFLSLSSYEKKIKNLKSLFKITEKLHPSIEKEMDILLTCSAMLRFTVEKHLINFGNKALENDNFTADLADMATYIFTLVACLSRVSLSLYNKTPSSAEELKIARVFAYEVQAKMKDFVGNIAFHESRIDAFKEVGDFAFNAKQYPLEHPLARGY